MRRYLPALIVAISAAIVALLWTSPPVTAQPVPPPGLRVVTHGDEMSGSGTAASPLGLRTDCSSTEGLAWDGNSWECSALGSTYTAGDGLSLAMDVFSINPCDEGEILKYTTGSWACAADATGGTIDGTGSTNAMTSWSDSDTLTHSTATTHGVATSSATASTTAFDVDATGTYNTTAGSLNSVGFWSTATTTRASGANALNNYGGRFAASGAQANYSLRSDGTSASGTSAWGGYFAATGAGTNTAVRAEASGGSTNIALSLSGALQANGDSGSVGEVLTLDGSGLPTWSAPGVNGSGTANKVAKWSDSDTLADSSISDDGSTASTTLPFTSSGKITAASGTSNGFALGSDATIVWDSGSSELDITANGQSFGLGASGKFQTTTDILGGGDLSVTGGIGGASITTSGDAFFGGTTTVAQLLLTEQEVSTTGTIDDLALNDTTTHLIFTGGSSIILTGMTGGADNRCILVTASTTSGAGVAITHEGSGSTAANRSVTAGSGSWTLISNATVMACYEGADSRWHWVFNTRFPSIVVSGSASAGSLAVTGTTTLSGNVVGGDGDSDTFTIRLPKDDGTPPTLSSCGTSPSVTGGSWAFTITTGSGGSPSCTATFASTKTNAPTCVVTGQGASDYNLSAVSATAITVTNGAGSIGAGSKIHVICIGDA